MIAQTRTHVKSISRAIVCLFCASQSRHHRLCIIRVPAAAATACTLLHHFLKNKRYSEAALLPQALPLTDWKEMA